MAYFFVNILDKIVCLHTSHLLNIEQLNCINKLHCCPLDFPKCYPALTIIGVKRLPYGAEIEISAISVCGKMEQNEEGPCPCLKLEGLVNAYEIPKKISQKKKLSRKH